MGKVRESIPVRLALETAPKRAASHIRSTPQKM